MTKASVNLSANSDTISLAGKWHYNLIGAPSTIAGEGILDLPGTLDLQRKSVYNPVSDNTNRLRREFSFAGEARYLKKIFIPETWKDKRIYLVMERTKPSTVFIDGMQVGSNSRISSPQRYEISDFVSSGGHELEIIVNNKDSIPPIVAMSSNAVSESTQTNWNGIIGDFLLVARPSFHINDVEINENTSGNVFITVDFSERAPEGFKIVCRLDGNQIAEKHIKIGSSSVPFSFPMPEKLWSANTPELNNLELNLLNGSGTVTDRTEITTGFRKFATEGKQFTVNGNPVFLRGTVNAAIFPLTAHPPMDEQSWRDYFLTVKSYGLNHVRFHSWTPPEAAFRAADETGVYLLVELPIWGELDRDLKFHNRFLKEELKGIMDSYASHPSFVMFSTGNELWGDISLMGEYMKEAKFLNPRILSTYGTNVYLGMNGQIGEEDFVISAKTNDKIENSIRGSVSFADSSTGGHFNSAYPNSGFNFSDATKNINVPVISHEVGQYQMYPDFSEIELYTGILKPDNLKEFKRRADENGLLNRNGDYLQASGKWAAKLYKAEMELAQRSEGIAGFELFGLQDYPGQGTATIGVLNPFMESKGVVTPEEWTQSAADILVLAEFPKFSFTEKESVEIPLKLVNYSGVADSIKSIYWKTEFAEGRMDLPPGQGVTDVGSIHLEIPKLSIPKKFSLSLKADNQITSNEYDFFVYPAKTHDVKKVSVTDNLTEALILLDQGEKVILCPDTATIAKASINPLFTTDFWNFRMFRTICDEMGLTPSPGTLGLFINKDHPAFQKFPTDIHTDWQWFPIVVNSRPLIIDRLPLDMKPIVEVIDNVEQNYRLALMLECNVGKGKLIILSSDIEKASQYPEGRWLLQSLKEYMAGKDFKPDVTLTPDQLVNLLTKPSNNRLIKELKNETYKAAWQE